METRIISAEDTYSIRHTILRPNQTIEDCHYPLDHMPETLHFGAFHNNQLVSITSFFEEKSEEFSALNQYRLRGMATLTNFRNMMAGSKQIQFAEEIMRSKKTNLWWCNARTTVAGYYLKLGLEITGEEFDIDPIGPHVLMSKIL